VEATRPVIRVYADGRSEPVTERIAEEAAWTLRVNGRELVTLIVTPDDLEDLVYGYLANEGLIHTADDVSTLVIDARERQMWVRVPTLRTDPEKLGRRLLTSCCGRGRLGLYFLNDEGISPVTDPASLPVSVVPALVQALDERASAFLHTGGVHSAGFARDGALAEVRSDVGRHNALDKLRGWMLRRRVAPDGAAIVFSGRISAEVVVKVARMRIPFILSNAAPTSLGRDLAEELGLTTLGFVRSGRFNLYTHPERVRLEAARP